MMYTIQPKKMLIINILKILEEHTDANHTLPQKEIVDLLCKDYEMVVDRKSVKRNLLNLIDFGYDICYTEITRKSKNGDDESICTDWYINRQFTDAELRLIIDGLIFSNNISNSHKKELIEKMEALSNKYFRGKIKHIKYAYSSSVKQGNPELFYTIEILDEAISANKQVSFFYNEMCTDKKMRPRKNSDGTCKLYTINPYQLAAINRSYYLICSNDKYQSISNYRLDRISGIKITNNERSPFNYMANSKGQLDLPRYMAEHIYMFPGESETVKFRAKRYLLTELYDWFGNNMEISDVTEEELIVTVRVNCEAMRKWALQYALHATIIYPQSVAETVKFDLLTAMENYNK